MAATMLAAHWQQKEEKNSSMEESPTLPSNGQVCYMPVTCDRLETQFAAISSGAVASSSCSTLCGEGALRAPFCRKYKMAVSAFLRPLLPSLSSSAHLQNNRKHHGIPGRHVVDDDHGPLLGRRSQKEHAALHVKNHWFVL